MAGWFTGPLGEQRFPIGRALQAGVPVLVGYERTSRSRRLPHVGQKCMRRVATRRERASAGGMGLQAVTLDTTY